MARENHRDPRLRLLVENLAHGIDGLGIQASERLIEHEHQRLEAQRGGQLDALLVPVAECLQLVARSLLQLKSLQPTGD